MVALVTASGCLATWHPQAAPSVRPLQLPARPASSLPPDGAYTVGSRVLVGHRRFVDNKPVGRPVLWTTDAVVPDAGAVWARLAARYSRTGLYPVMLSAADEDTSGYPWLSGEFDPDTSGPLSTDPAKVMGERYAEYRDGVETDHPPRRLPSLRTTWRGGPDLGAAIGVVDGLRGRIGLAAVARPADVPYAIGWEGTANYFDSRTVTTVLRSWEDRYGALLVDLDEDQLVVAVPNPPRTIEAARPIALELLAFCPDVPYEAGLDQTARDLVDNPAWSCWWD